MTKIFSSEKGISTLSVIVFAAVVVAVLTGYSYYNPRFTLSKYSPLNYFRIKQDDKRIEDLKSLETAVLKFYDENNGMPANEGFCGRISGVLHPEFRDDVKLYFDSGDVPQDPLRANSEKDYFYYRVDRSHYVLMAALEIPRDQGFTSDKYNFTGCHDWPGNGVYNYQVSNVENWLQLVA